MRNYPRENTEDVLDEKEVSLFVRHYSKNMYNAIMQCTLNSLQAMKRRLGSKTTTGIFFMERPFFDVDVELKVPSVCMNPTLEEIQAAINQCAKKVLTISKQLPAWGMDNVATYHEMIAGDKEVVKAVLRLTGSVEGIKTQVGEYIRTFDKYDFLWKEDLQVRVCPAMLSGLRAIHAGMASSRRRRLDTALPTYPTLPLPISPRFLVSAPLTLPAAAPSGAA